MRLFHRHQTAFFLSSIHPSLQNNGICPDILFTNLWIALGATHCPTGRWYNPVLNWKLKCRWMYTSPSPVRVSVSGAAPWFCGLEVDVFWQFSTRPVHVVFTLCTVDLEQFAILWATPRKKQGPWLVWAWQSCLHFQQRCSTFFSHL